MIDKRRFLAAAACAVASPSLFAQAWPQRPLRLLVGFAAGGPADGIARAFAKDLEADLKQPVVVENRPGAAGIVSLDAITNSPPDGYTLLLLANTTTTALHFNRKALDIDKRFTPISSVVATRIILVVNPKMIDVQNIKQFIEYVKKNPQTPYTSAGHGGLGHLGMELFAQQTKVPMMHVAYKGTTPALEDVIGGRVGAMIIDATSAMPHIRAGTLRPVVTVSTVRAPLLPDLPTALEQGVSSFQIDSVLGLVAPPRLPKPITDRLRAAAQRSIDSIGFTTTLRQSGNAKSYMDAAQYRAWMQQDFDRWGRVVRDAGLAEKT